MIHRRPWLVAALGGVSEEVCRVKLRAIPKLIQIAVKKIGAGFGHVVHLRSAIASFIHRVRERIHRDFRIEFSPKTRFVESPLFKLVKGSFVSSPSTMKPFESAGKPLNCTLP